MSINWVMLDGPSSFVRLPRETVLFTSPTRTSLALQTPNSYPGKEPLSIKSSDGKAIITNQRLIYIPAAPTPALQSLSAPLLNLQDTHAAAPFFGPNYWEGVLTPVPGGGIPPQHTLVQLKFTFKDGGAFDFSTIYERIKETLSQALDVARESGRTTGPDVDLEQLPAYEEASAGGQAPAQVQRPTPIAPNGTRRPRPAPPANNGVVGLASPSEPPPGYDEVQHSSVADQLERSVDEKR